MTNTDAQFLGERIHAIVDGEEVTIWNRVTLKVIREIGPESVTRHHELLIGDGSVPQSPEYITPAVEEELKVADVYPAPEVIDPTDDKVTLL